MEPRLPKWCFLAIAAGSCCTYLGVGIVLEGLRFPRDLQHLLSDPAAFAAGNPELYAPFVLLLIPAVLGGFATRALLRIVIVGIREGRPLPVIAKAIASFLLGALLLVIVALFTSPNVRR